MACATCGGTIVFENLACLRCYGDAEGSGCGTDGCPAFGISTENRCRCEHPSPDLPVIFFDQLFHIPSPDAEQKKPPTSRWER